MEDELKEVIELQMEQIDELNKLSSALWRLLIPYNNDNDTTHANKNNKRRYMLTASI